MAYFIFLKYLRSLEEFRKNPHVKIPPKFPCANFQSLAKFKNPIFNLKNFLLHFRLGYPYRPTRPSAQPAPLAPLLPQAEANFAGPSRSAHARRWRICKNMFSSLIHAFRSRRLLSIHSLIHGPHMSVSSSPPRRPTLAVSPPRHRSPRRPLRASDAVEPLPPPSLTPLIPFKPSLNGLNSHSSLPLLRPPLRRPPPAYKSHPEDPWGAADGSLVHPIDHSLSFSSSKNGIQR
jgi:hypothetical protein